MAAELRATVSRFAVEMMPPIIGGRVELMLLLVVSLLLLGTGCGASAANKPSARRLQANLANGAIYAPGEVTFPVSAPGAISLLTRISGSGKPETPAGRSYDGLVAHQCPRPPNQLAALPWTARVRDHGH